jgi:hypothetical protein
MAGLLDLINQRAPTPITPIDTTPLPSATPRLGVAYDDLIETPHQITDEQAAAAAKPTIQHSWEAGVNQTSSMLKNAVAGTAQALGSTDFSARMRQSAQADDAEAEQSMQDSHAVTSLKEVGGLGDFGNFLGHSIIRNTPQLGVMAAGALATRGRSALGQTLGTAAPSAAMNFGGTYDEGMQGVEQGIQSGQYNPAQAAQLKQQVLTNAALAAPVMAALDTLGFSTIFKTGPMRQSVVKAITSSLPAHIRRSVLAEGSTEALQEYVQKAAAQHALENPDAFGLTPDDKWRLADAFVQGGAAGGAFATPGHLAAPAGAAARWAGQNVVDPALNMAGRMFGGRQQDAETAPEGAAPPVERSRYYNFGAQIAQVLDSPDPLSAARAAGASAFEDLKNLPVVGGALQAGQDIIEGLGTSQRVGRAVKFFNDNAAAVQQGFAQFQQGYGKEIDPALQSAVFERYKKALASALPISDKTWSQLGGTPETRGAALAEMINGFNQGLLSSADVAANIVDKAAGYAGMAASAGRTVAQGVQEVAPQVASAGRTIAQGVQELAPLAASAGRTIVQGTKEAGQAVAPVAKDLGQAALNLGEAGAIAAKGLGQAAVPGAKLAAKATKDATAVVRDTTAGLVDGIRAYEQNYGKVPEEPPPPEHPDEALPPNEAAAAARTVTQTFAETLGVQSGLVDANGRPLKKQAVDPLDERIVRELLIGKKEQPWSGMAPNLPLAEARDLAHWLTRVAENPRLVQQVLGDADPAVTNEMVRLTGYTPREVFGHVFRVLRAQGADKQGVSGDSMEGREIFAGENAQEQRAVQAQEQAADEGEVEEGHELALADIEARTDEYGDQGVNDRALEEEADVAAGDAAAQRFEASLSKQDPREDPRKEFGGKAWVLKMTQLIDPETGKVVSRPNITPHRVNLVNLRKQSRFSRTLKEDEHLSTPDKIYRDFADAVADLFNGWSEDVVGQDGKTYIKKVSIFPATQHTANGKLTALPRKSGLEKWISDDAVVDTSKLTFGQMKGVAKAAPRFEGRKGSASYAGAMEALLDAPIGKEKNQAEKSLAIEAAGYLNTVVPMGNDATGATRQEALDAYNDTAEYVGNAKAPPVIDWLHQRLAEARESKVPGFVERVLGRMQQAVQQNSLQPFSEGEAVDPAKLQADFERLQEMAKEPTEAELDAHVGNLLRAVYDRLQKRSEYDGQVVAAIRLLPTEVLQNQQAKIEERLEKIYKRQILQPFETSEQESSVDNPEFNKGRTFADEEAEFGTKPSKTPAEPKSAKLRRDRAVAQVMGQPTAAINEAGRAAVAEEKANAGVEVGSTDERGTPNYVPRTKENIKNSDATVALALDFGSGGEVLTKNYAAEIKKPYVGINLRTKVEAAANEIATQLKAHGAHSVNIAGNGISSLLKASSQQTTPEAMQQWVDNRVLEILKAVHAQYPISEIRSGGQTGIDEAGIKAATALGIPAKALLPKNFMIRTADNRDHAQTYEQTLARLYPTRPAMAPEATMRPAEQAVTDIVSTQAGENVARKAAPSPKAPFSGDQSFNPAAPTTGSAPPSGDTKSPFSPKKTASSDLTVEQMKDGKVGSTPNNPFNERPKVASAVTPPLPENVPTGIANRHVFGMNKRTSPTNERPARQSVLPPFAGEATTDSSPVQTFTNEKARPPRRRVDTAEIEAERGSPYMNAAETAAAIRAIRERKANEAAGTTAEPAANPVMDQTAVQPGPLAEERAALRKMSDAELANELQAMLEEEHDRYTHRDRGEPFEDDPYLAAIEAETARRQKAAPEVAAKRPKEQAVPRSGAGKKASKADFAGDIDFSTPEGEAKLRAEIRKIAGDLKIRLLPVGHPDLEGAAGTYDPAEHVITLAANPNGALGTGYHEALHAIFRAIDPRDRRELNLMLRHNAKLRGAIKEKLKDFPEAQKDAMEKPEEMAAYAFQFWKTDPAFKDIMSPVGNHWFQKIENFIHHVWAWMRGQAGADEIFQRIADGLYSEGADHAANVLAKEAAKKGRIQQVANAAMRGYETIWDKLLRSMDDRLRDVGLDELTAIAQKLYAQTGEQGERGLAQAIPARTKKFMNRLSVALGPDKEIAQKALESMANGTTESAEVEKVKKQLRSFLNAMLDYANGPRSAKTKINYTADYLPLQWSGNKIEANQAAFLDMLYRHEDRIAKINEDLKERYEEAHRTLEGFKEFTPESLMEKMIRRNREENIPIGGVLNEYGTPTAHHAEDRVLPFITNADRRPFIEDNHLAAMNQYVKQMVRNTEYVQRFGENGHKLHQMLDKARAAGATPEQLHLVHDSIDNIYNVRYDNADPMLRFAGAWIQTYQNYRVLGLSVLSSIIDPLALAVRTQEFGEAWDAYKYAIHNLIRGEKPSDLQLLAEDLGAIEREGVMSSLADMYGGFEDEKETKKLNDMLFTYNGMNGLTRALREFAVGAGIRFISKHAKGVDKANSDRWIRELGISPADVQFKADGTLMIKQRDFMNAGMDRDEAQAAAEKIQDALLRFVDESVLAPNAMERPNWGSDPMWGLLFHLKQYLFSFQKVVGRRIVHEVEMQDSDAPLLFAAPFIPIMAASGLVRDLITHGGGLPPDAGFMHYLTKGFDRVGFQGPTDIPMDVAGDLIQGRNPMKTVGGPTLEQALEGLEVIGSDSKVQALWKWIVEGMPGQSIYRRALT